MGRGGSAGGWLSASGSCLLLRSGNGRASELDPAEPDVLSLELFGLMLASSSSTAWIRCVLLMLPNALCF